MEGEVTPKNFSPTQKNVVNVVYLDSINLGIGALLRRSVATSVTC